MNVYHFDTLMGTVYRKGNVLFLPESETLLSPVGNRISKFDLKKNETKTLPVESSHDYTAIDVSPNGRLLVAGNEIGEVHVISLISLSLLNMLKVGKPPSVIKFAPSGEMFAVAKESLVFVYQTPSATKKFNPSSLLRVFATNSEVTCIDWSFDSKLILIGGKDMMLRVYGFEKYKNFVPAVFTNHSDSIVNAFFVKDSYDLYSVSRNRQLCEWHCSASPEEFVPLSKSEIDARRAAKHKNKPANRKAAKAGAESDESEDDVPEDDDDKDEQTGKRSRKKSRSKIADNEPETMEEVQDAPNQLERVHFIKQGRHYLYDVDAPGVGAGDGEQKFADRRIKLTCAAYNKGTEHLFTGYSDGVFIMHTLPDLEKVKSYSISEHHISTICLNPRGDWIAFGCPTLGQLLVWEWPSDSYVLKQQGHLNTMHVCAFSMDGRHIVTGGQDGKVKVWESRSSFCFVTFDDHTSTITGVIFTQNGKALLSSSLDGTVRAFDLVRYRNFRTFTSPHPAQFSCVTVDSSGQFVAAGATDVFDLFLWSMQTGKLLEVFGGHEGPVTAVRFSPTIGSSQLASISLDKTLRVWETIETSGAHETVQLNSEGTCLVYRPDGEEIAVGTLDCHILLFKSANCQQRGTIEGRNHLGSGVSMTDKISAKKNLAAKAFTTLSYSPDGAYLLAAGESQNICYYDSERQMLLKKYKITQNKSLDGMNEFIHHKNITEFGNLALVNKGDEFNDKLSLPGVKAGDMSSRSVRPTVRVTSVCFSPTGMQWIATSTEGLFLYNHDTWRIFVPFSADEDVAPETIKKALNEHVYDKALMYSLRLNLKDKIREVFEHVPVSSIEAVCKALTPDYWVLFMQFLAAEIGESRHFQFCLKWAKAFLGVHLSELKQDPRIRPALNMLEKNMVDKQKDLITLTESNKYMMEFLIVSGKSIKAQKKADAEAAAAAEGGDDSGLIPEDEIKMEMDEDEEFDSDSDDPATKVQILDSSEIKVESETSSDEDELFLMQKFPSEM